MSFAISRAAVFDRLHELTFDRLWLESGANDEESTIGKVGIFALLGHAYQIYRESPRQSTFRFPTDTNRVTHAT